MVWTLKPKRKIDKDKAPQEMARAKDGVSQLPPVLLHVKAKKAPGWKERFAV